MSDGGSFSCDHPQMGPRVLIVDDHPSFRHFAKRLLDAAGFRVVGEAGDGASALAEARRLRPDLVLLDVLLPDMSGLAIAEALAADSYHPRVVLVSSRSASELGAALQQSSADGFIAKSELTAATLAAFASGPL
jgi:DNA-binding NarL/FixJ family response regulator